MTIVSLLRKIKDSILNMNATEVIPFIPDDQATLSLQAHTPQLQVRSSAPEDQVLFRPHSRQWFSQ
jgi:hypothetical protein